MKKILSVFILIIVISVVGKAQNTAAGQIDKASVQLDKKNYKEAQLALQAAISYINLIMEEQVLDSMQLQIEDVIADTTMDQKTSSGSCGAGFTVNRMLTDGKGKSVNITVVMNSSMLKSVEMMIKDPSLLPAEGKQKVVKISGRKCLSAYNESDKDGNVQIPLSSSIIIIDMEGYADEATCIAFVQKVNIDAIRDALGE